MNAILMLMAAVMPADGAAPQTSSGEIDLSGVVMLEFTGDYCVHCQRMLPAIRRMQADNLPVQQIHLKEHPKLLSQFHVEWLPTFVVLVNGREVDRFIGPQDEQKLRNAISSAQQSIAKPRPRSVTEMFTSVLGMRRNEPPTVRGQDPQAVPVAADSSARTISPQLQAGLGAVSVRVQVQGVSRQDDSKITDVGTGTVIFSRDGESVVLTCAHLFLGMKAGPFVEVETLSGGEPARYVGKVIGGSHASDLALIRLTTPSAIPFVPLSKTAPLVEAGSSAVAFGCSHGDLPTPMLTEVSQLNPLDGPDHMMCLPAPVHGRSGGGLFTLQGQLIGVCSCSDEKNQQGMYMGYQPILELIRKTGLEYVLDPPPAMVPDS
ncbi:MAG: trypsin-like peptidase domain-containing protein, partial [Planctomycetaceae bacterium]|nr:trypsin-like peptidase domain-containing protein [Planctomycetaceae bacterium]